MKKFGPALPPYMVKKRKAMSKLKSEVKRVLPGPYGEAKYVDLAFAGYGADTTGSVTHCSIIPQGSTVGQREGRTCIVTACHLRGNVSARSTCKIATASWMLVWDNQPNKALAGITDILDSASCEAQNKRENVNRFKIVRRCNYAVSGNDTTAGQQTDHSIFFVDEYIKLPKGCITVYTTADTTGVIANCIQGALLLVTCGNQPAGNSAVYVNVNVRTSFKDI